MSREIGDCPPDNLKTEVSSEFKLPEAQDPTTLTDVRGAIESCAEIPEHIKAAMRSLLDAVVDRNSSSFEERSED